MKQIRLLAFLLLASFAFVIKAEEEMFETELFRFIKLSDTAVSVSTKTDITSPDIKIPTEVTFDGKTYNVTRVNFFAATKLEELVIPATITEVGYNAFSHCYGLRRIVIDPADSPIDFLIGEYGSRDPFSAGPVEEVVINRDIVDHNHSSSLFSSDRMVKAVIGDNVKILPSYIFRGATVLSDVTLGSSLEVIGTSAFSDCSSLKSITFGNSLREIGSWAFMLTALEEIVIPANVTAIGRHFVGGVKSLKKMIIEDGDSPVSFSDDYSGAWTLNCSLDSVYVGRTVPGYAFEKTPIAALGIGSKVTAIGNCTFSGSEALSKVLVPGSVKNIGAQAFDGCSNLVSLTLDEGVETIGANAFNQTGISSLTLPSTLKSVDDYAFYGNANLESVVISSASGSVRFNGSGIFDSCPKLKKFNIGKSITGTLQLVWLKDLDELVFGDMVTRVSDNLFYDLLNVGKLTFGSGTTDAKKWFYRGMVHVKDLYLADSDKSIALPYLTVEDNFYFGRNLKEEDGSASLTYGKDVKVEIGPMVTDIPEGFCYENSMTEFSIPENIRRINSYAFANVKLKAISIPSGVEFIGKHAFSDCPLKELVFEDGPTPLEIEYFPESKAVEKLHVGRDIIGINFLDAVESELTLGTGLTRISDSEFCQNTNFPELTVPEGVTVIERWGLMNCRSMHTLRLPSTLESLGEEALHGCYSLLTVEVAATVPPAYRGSNTFPYPRIATLYVPLGCKEIYEEKWGIEFVAVVEKDFSGAGIPGLNEEARDMICDVFTLAGTPVCRGVCAGGDEVRSLGKGVYIAVPHVGNPFRIVR